MPFSSSLDSTGLCSVQKVPITSCLTSDAQLCPLCLIDYSCQTTRSCRMQQAAVVFFKAGILWCLGLCSLCTCCRLLGRWGAATPAKGNTSYPPNRMPCRHCALQFPLTLVRFPCIHSLRLVRHDRISYAERRQRSPFTFGGMEDRWVTVS